MSSSLLSASTFLAIMASVIAFKDPRCYPPPQIVLDSSCVQGDIATNSNFDCDGGHFVQSAGIHTPCEHDGDCAQTTRPNEWCNAEGKGYQLDARGCHCDRKLHGCTIQRFDKRTNDIQWSFCLPANRYACERADYCSFPKP